MATRTKKVDMGFSVVEKPKKAGGFGKQADPEKTAHLTELIKAYVAWAKDNVIAESQDTKVGNLGKWTPTALSITGNKMLDVQRENGNDPGFYFVATERPETGKNAEGKAIYGEAQSLVIRNGSKPTRKRSDNGSAQEAAE